MAYNPSQSTSSSSWWQPQQPSAQSQQPLSAYSTNARQSTWGTQSQLGEDTMEDVTSKGGDHLPGYLTNASYGRSPPSLHSPSLSSSRQNWSGAPLGRSTGSPPGPVRFGTGSLFDSRSRPDPYNDNGPPAVSMSYEDAPPVNSLDDADAGEAYPPMQSLSDSQSTQHQHDQYGSSPSNASNSNSSYPPSSAGSLASTVIVFGPPMSLFQPILQYFSQLGDILGSEVDSSGGNWVTIVYRQEWEAARAVRKNGDVLGGIWMVGVKWADPNRNDQPTSLSDASPSLLPQQQSSSSQSLSPIPSSSLSTSTSTQNGRAIQLAPSTSAFRRESPRPPTAGDGKSFLVKESQGGSQQPAPQEGKGVLGKLGELVFGF